MEYTLVFGWHVHFQLLPIDIQYQGTLGAPDEINHVPDLVRWYLTTCVRLVVLCL